VGTSTCGNGTPEGAEECDDGNDENTDACTNACTIARCGDGVVRTGVEQCDDGNDVPNDGCTNCVNDPPVCGNGIVQQGETCDDGNTVDGDACPANCRIEPCTVTATRVATTVTLNYPNSVVVGTVVVFVEYPDGRVSIPGSGSEASVAARITNQPTGFASAPFDLDYAFRESLVAFNRTLPKGQLVKVSYDLCSGATAPNKNDFQCTVQQAATPQGVNLPVTNITCAVTVP
jgi:cysteine-rich repeat protein